MSSAKHSSILSIFLLAFVAYDVNSEH